MPILISHLGVDRFGSLALVWMLIGYYSLFDLGLGRALTKLVAEKLGEQHNPSEISGLVWTALGLLFVLGLVGTLVLIATAPVMVTHVLKVPPGLRSETKLAIYLLAVALPLVTSTAGLRGVLEAHQRFDLSSATRTGMGIFNFGGPLLALAIGNTLPVVVATLVLGRTVSWLLHIWLCTRVVPSLGMGFEFRRAAVRPLVGFGTWLTVSNVLSPLLSTLDRLLIGTMVSIQAVAYYATPYELLMRILGIPGALTGVMFPAFSTTFANDQRRTALLFDRATRCVFVFMFLIILVVTAFSHWGLRTWLGDEFAQRSTRVMQLLALGTLLNGLGLVPFALVQGVGRPDLTAKLHLCELPLYVPLLWWLIRAHGIEGAALAWLLRMMFDTGALFIIATRLLPECKERIRRLVPYVVGSGILLPLFAISSFDLLNAGMATVTIAAFAVTAWIYLLTPEERRGLRVGAGTRIGIH